MANPALLAPFIGKMDGVLVSRFVYQLDNYFKIVGLTDDIKMGRIAITIFKGTAYNCFAVECNNK